MSTRTASHTGEPDWRRTLAAAIWTATGLIAVVLISRRLGGHFTHGLPAGPTTLVVMLLTALNLLAAGCLRSPLRRPSTNCWTSTDHRPFRSRGGRTDWPVALAIGVATLVPPFAAGLTLLPTGSTAGLSALAALFLIAALLMLLAGNSFRFPQYDFTHKDPGDFGKSLRSSPTEPQNTAAATEAADPPWLPGPDHLEGAGRVSVSQWMSRSHELDGGETVEGGMTLRLPAGQKSAVFHVAFCPPLTGTPEVTCHLLDEVPLRLRVTTAQPYGTRIEAKRTGEPADDVEATIAYLAVTLPTTPAAAANPKAA